MAPKEAVNKTVKVTNDDAKISSVENQGGAGQTPRPTDEAAEPAHKRNRADTEAEKRAVYEAVTAAFLERLPGTQFEGNARAQESLRQFIDDCEQGKETEELDHQAHLTVMSLTSESKFMSSGRANYFLKPEQEMKLIVIAAVEAGTGIKRNSLFDGWSVVDFPLGGDENVKVLVAKWGMSNADNPLYRHLKVAAFQPDDVRRVASAITAPDGPLPLFYGSSGSGKTTCGMAMAAQLTTPGGKPGACIRLVCGADCFSFVPADAPHLKDLPLLKSQGPIREFTAYALEKIYKESGPKTQMERDLVAQHLVLRSIERVIDVDHRGTPKDARFLVVFLDEAGDYPTLVRAMCSCFRTLQSTISDRFSGGKCQVRLVIAGIGIEGADHRVGSQPQSVLPYHVRPRIWPALKEKLPSEANAVKLLLENDESTLVRIVHGIVQNARVAALLFRQLDQASDPNVSGAVNVSALHPSIALKSVAVAAGETYRKLNSRGALTEAADFAMMLRAMAQQTSTTPLQPLAWYDGCLVLVDRAEPRHKSAKDLKDLQWLSNTNEKGVGLYLHRDYLGVRYELEISQTAMLQLALKIGDHPATPAGFVSGIVDFIAMAMELSRSDLGMNFNLFNTTTAKAPWPMPRGWNAPLMLAERLRCNAPASLDRTRAVAKETVDIKRILSTRKLEPQTPAKVGSMKEYIAKNILPEIKKGRGLIITNRDAALYANVNAFFGCTDLVLVQAKLCMETAFSDSEVFEELHKMGNRDWRTVLAMFHRYKEALPTDNVPPWITEKVNETQFTQCIESPPPEALAQAVKAWLSASMYGKANPVTEQLRQSGSKTPLCVTYAIMVYGTLPAEVANVPDNVLLLYAPDPSNAPRTAGRTGSDSTARQFAAEQLWSYYPITLSLPVSPPHCDPITTPRDES
jgi:hypothetical protein